MQVAKCGIIINNIETMIHSLNNSSSARLKIKQTCGIKTKLYKQNNNRIHKMNDKNG